MSETGGGRVRINHPRPPRAVAGEGVNAAERIGHLFLSPALVGVQGGGLLQALNLSYPRIRLPSGSNKGSWMMWAVRSSPMISILNSLFPTSSFGT
jgi:hypothetical protein